MDLKDQFDKLNDAYNGILRMCYEALAEGTPQDAREALRIAINDFLQPTTEG